MTNTSAASSTGFKYPAENTLRWEMHQCFAYDGVKGTGVIDQYQCGIFDRVQAWFDDLGLKYSVTPQVEGCLMHSEGKCYRVFTFNLQSE